MSVNFNNDKCQSISKEKLFGLCDDPPPAKNPAYLDETDRSKWIAVVVNAHNFIVTFTAIDACIDIFREDGKMAKRCDGMLTYNNKISFVELKDRSPLGNEWVKDGEKQLRATISYFEKTDQANDFLSKKAYIANKRHPEFKNSQLMRMEKFYSETGYVLRIEGQIILD